MLAGVTYLSVRSLSFFTLSPVLPLSSFFFSFLALSIKFLKERAWNEGGCLYVYWIWLAVVFAFCLHKITGQQIPLAISVRTA